ncbi:MAG: helix-turn-helix transcriptional regulator [Spirochaetales bacterium]|nr:helix-turn-helix transcriptional regulator [Spirochaetales bacterium]
MLLDHRPVLSLEETGSNIKKLRMEKGISVKELQGLLGFDNPQAIYNWERGRNMPSIDNLLVLSEIFGVSINEIVGKNFLNGFPA